MTNIVWGAWISGDAGSIGTHTSPVSNSGGTNVDSAIGAFTGLADLPTSIDSDEDFLAFAAALVAKTTEVYDGGISVTDIFALRLYAVGGGGNDVFSVYSTDDGHWFGRGGDDQLTSESPRTDDNMDGGAGHDLLSAGGGANSLLGGEGNDTVHGGDVVDTIDGGPGHDQLFAFQGNDALSGGGGDDTLDGGTGGDTADYRSAAAGVTVNLAETGPQVTGGAGIDTLVDIEALIGSVFEDRLTGDVDPNRLDGRGGRDVLTGDGGNDTLIGAAGQDVFNGGDGADRMSGGPGRDRYYYSAVDDSPAGGADLITDLAAEDRILLTDIDAKTDKAGNQGFELVAAFTGKSGQAVLVYDAGADITELRLDVTGDAVADGLIRMLGDHTGFTNFAL